MRCPFCALPEMGWADDPWQFMSIKLFKSIVDDITTWRPKVRVEFAERGEQSFHKNLLEMIAYMRFKLPKVQMTITSNGDTLRKFNDDIELYGNWVDELLNAGLNIMMIDCYTKQRYKEFKSFFRDAVLFYEDDFHPYRYIGPKTRVILLVDGAIGKNHIIRRWHNAAGSVNAELAKSKGYDIATIIEPRESMCVRPFREMEIHVDGTIPICCNDWKEDTIVSKFPELPLEDIWWKLDEYRKILLEKHRKDIKPCDVCSERAGFRVGLEMDWFRGKD